MKYLSTFTILLFATLIGTQALSQSYAFGFKGGPSLNRQSWTGDGDRALLLSYFGDVYIETAGSEKYAFGASFGYHNRGSTQKFSGGLNPNGGFNSAVRYPSRLGNLSLLAYMKQYFKIENSDNRYYYFFGGRADYNVVKDLGRYDIFDPLVNNFTYGITAGGGFDWSFGELWGGFVEFSIAPDFTEQIYIPQSRGIPTNTGETTTVEEGAVYNLSIELSVGLRFMHIITYVEG